LKNYLWYAEKTYAVRTITPYFKNKHKEITKSPSIYFHDIGMRNFALGMFGNLTSSNQFGFVFQNFVASTLFEKISNTSQNLHFWRTLDGAEVDFIINDGASVLPIEAKYANFKKPQVTSALTNFIRKYSPAEAWIINLNLETEIKIENTIVKFIPYHSL
jgi:predicted AAA+ superfamily ATPase